MLGAGYKSSSPARCFAFDMFFFDIVVSCICKTRNRDPLRLLVRITYHVSTFSISIKGIRWPATCHFRPGQLKRVYTLYSPDLVAIHPATNFSNVPTPMSAQLHDARSRKSPAAPQVPRSQAGHLGTHQGTSAPPEAH